MSILAATCATLAAILATAQPGDTVKLSGDCGEIAVANRYRARVTIDASKASVAGLKLSGTNIAWVGGVLVAPDGMDGFASRGYAVVIAGTGIRLSKALITDAKKGIVIDRARNVVVDNNKFWRLREDGIIASRLVNAQFDDNAFSAFLPRKTRCELADGTVTEGVAQRDCAGTWTDGNHADAIQMRNGVISARIRRNTIAGDMQGIGQFDTTGDLPLERVLIEGNRVAGSQFHQITLYDCLGCRIERNVVRRGDPSRRAVIRPGTATTCGNDVEGERPDPLCE